MITVEDFMPWRLKIFIKLVLSVVPGRHVILRKLGMFRHGDMDDQNYARRVFETHIQRAYPEGMPKGLTILELGPGDSVLSGLIAHQYGVSKSWMIDAGDYAQKDLCLYKNHIDDETIESFDALLEAYNIEYLTRGLESLQSIPSNAVDFIFSQAVLEHVRKADFAETMRELARILKPGGVMSHKVDLRDHLDSALNNLRFPEWFWEHEWVARAGFYTNRIQYKDGIEAMRAAGLDAIPVRVDRWDALPTPKSVMQPGFSVLPDDELNVSGYAVLLKKAA